MNDTCCKAGGGRGGGVNPILHFHYTGLRQLARTALCFTQDRERVLNNSTAVMAVHATKQPKHKCQDRWRTFFFSWRCTSRNSHSTKACEMPINELGRPADVRGPQRAHSHASGFLILSRMQLVLHATRRTPHHASRLV